AKPVTDDSTSAQPDSPSARRGSPPLRIHHILIATAAVAVLLAISRIAIAPTSGLAVLYLISGGVAWTIVGLGIAWRRAGHSFFQHPGHWMLMTFAISTTSSFVRRFNYAIWQSTGHLFGLFFVFGWISSCVLLACDFVAAWKRFGSSWWRYYFIARGAWLIAPFVVWEGIIRNG